MQRRNVVGPFRYASRFFSGGQLKDVLRSRRELNSIQIKHSCGGDLLQRRIRYATDFADVELYLKEVAAEAVVMPQESFSGEAKEVDRPQDNLTAGCEPVVNRSTRVQCDREAPMHGGVGNEDKEAIQQRLKMIDEVYPGPKTAGFYEEIERAGFAIERPPLQRTSEHEVRDVLDRIAGRFVANGSYDEAFTSLRPLAVKFEYGLAPDPTQPLPPGLVMPTLNREELKLYPLAKDINAICWHLAERAPRILAESFMQDVGDDTWQRDMGFTLNDMRLDADVERKKKERKDRERKRDDGDGGGRLRSFQYTTSLLPMILSWISHLA